ncbi:methylated-DNA--[protein]-cysteine S-methyltransferase [Rhabdothermincola sediminis]|uniref:methylated-DNA--[protein]-cysteine S-methyltransferase n=1 Tax=Rhabdothermincola sediminis TaxID=2751370 RepID=UPI001AA08486|nr:methylated-DNA--[protein]-cysteine S-methyltransferase [Rhabdothermincola sediminis]
MRAVSTISTPIGPLTLEATDSGLRSVTFGGGRGGRNGSPTAAHQLALAERELQEYFAGERSSFTVPLDWPAMTGFRRAVLTELVSVPYGEVVTYGELASRAGRPGAARAVGSAMATNPLAVVVPCHRVIRSGGVLGNYGDDPRKKVWLLSLEGYLSGRSPSDQP